MLHYCVIVVTHSLYNVREYNPYHRVMTWFTISIDHTQICKCYMFRPISNLGLLTDIGLSLLIDIVLVYSLILSLNQLNNLDLKYSLKFSLGLFTDIDFNYSLILNLGPLTHIDLNYPLLFSLGSLAVNYS